MPRTARLHIPNSLQHTISRFMNREYLMEGAPERVEYLRRAGPALGRVDGQALCYCLMSNHIHWAILAGCDPLSTVFRSLNGGFAGWLNDRWRRLGPAFAERFTTVICPEERFAILVAYIHNNPVRAGLVADPLDCDWSSHQAYVGCVEAPPWMDVERGLSMAGFDSSPTGRLNFHEFVLSRAPLGRDPLLSGDGLKHARRQARVLTGSTCEVSDSSIEPVTLRPERQIYAVQGAVVRPRWSGSATAVLEAAAHRLCIATDDVRSRSRIRDVVAVRRLALWLWNRHLGRLQCEMSGVLGISSSSASKLLRDAPPVSEADISALVETLWAGRDLLAA